MVHLDVRREVASMCMNLLSDRCLVRGQVARHPVQEQWICTVDWVGEGPRQVLSDAQYVVDVDDTV